MVLRKLKWVISLVLVLVVTTMIVLSCAIDTPTYETGYVTKGNPDNSYLDSCEVYCCGD